MMRFGRNSEARKVWYRKRKTPKCHFRFCGTVNNKGHSFRKGVPFKWSKQKSVCGISVVKREIAVVKPRRFPFLVDSKGIEPSTSAMRKVI